MNEGLRHPEAEQRRRAVSALTSGEVAHSLQDLYALLDDSDWRVRREVALALARLSDPRPALVPLVDAVIAGDVSRRNAAMEALRNIGTASAEPVLARLDDAPGGTRRFLIEVLADTGTEACAARLASALDDRDENIPPAAAEALGRIPGRAASTALRGALRHRDPVVRLAALQAFAARDEAIDWPTLAPLLSDPICRRAALRAAASSPDAGAIEAIVAALSDANVALSSEAAVAAALAARRGRRDGVRAVLLARAGASRVLRHLAAVRGVIEVRRAAIECLGLIADPASVVSVLHGTDTPETSAVAVEALDRFGGEAVGHALDAAETLGANATAAMLRWALERASAAEHPTLVRAAWRAIEAGADGVAAWDAIAAVGTREDGERLIARLDAPSSHIDPAELSRPLVTLLARHAELASRLAEAAPLTTRLGLLVAGIVAAAGHPVPLEPLRESLTAPDPAVRAAAVRALGNVRNEPRARDALEFALADEDASVQAAAAEALGALGGDTDVLEQSLRAAEPRVRRAAAHAIGRRGGGGVRSVLMPALDDPDPAVVLAALEGMGAEATVDDLMNVTTHPDSDVAAEALVRLRALDPIVAGRAAFRMLTHPVWSVRLEAVRSLDASNGDVHAALLRQLESERDELVRDAIDQLLAPAAGSVPVR